MTTTAASPAFARHAAGAKPFRIAVGCDDARADLLVPTSDGSCWAALLGPFTLPDDGALDLIADAAERWWDALPASVELVGSPAACLLPLVWLRSIWLGEETEVAIVWSRVGQPGEEPCEQLAARLACGLADRVECPDAARAIALWGIDTVDRAPLAGEAFDLLLGLVDAWDLRTRNGPVIDPTEWQLRTRSALRECAEAGLSKVALYGAGTHTKALGPLLQDPPVDIDCIIDDDPNRHGRRLWGFPIVSREDALRRGVKAVVLSANLFEAKLYANCGPFHEAGVRVVRLYTGGEA